MTAFLGMRGTGDWATDQRPKNWREGILKEFPNGDVPITAINSRGASEATDDPEFNWWSKSLELQGGNLFSGANSTGNVFSDSGLSSAYTDAATAISVGTVVYAKCAEATASHFRVGHTALLIDRSDNSQTIFGKVVGVNLNGATSSIAVKVRVATTYAVAFDCDYIDIVGSSNPEGGVIPDSVTYDPTKYLNYTQIFRTPLDITRTARKTRLRTGDAYAEMKREAMLYHGVEMEMAVLFGEKSEVTGDNGKPERTSQGGISFVTENASDNVQDFVTSTGNTWLQAGEDWLDEQIELLFRHGGSERLGYCGSGALLGIQRLVKGNSNFTFTPETAAYGIKVMRWTTPFGDLLLKRHPLFSYKDHRTNDVFIHDPANLKFRYIDDTTFRKDPNENKAGFQAIDGCKEEFLTEGGWEWHFPNTMMYLRGVGLDGTA